MFRLRTKRALTNVSALNLVNQFNETLPPLQTTSVAGAALFQAMPRLITPHCWVVPLKVILVKLVQYWNAYAPMLVTLLPILTLSNLLQFPNALLPMLVTLSVIVTLVKFVQPWNAQLPMVATDSPITTLVIPEHPKNASLSIVITLLGIIISVR